MIKMNFNNKLEGEDKQLIQLLKEEIKEFPSDLLEEKTMNRISAMSAEKKFVYKPLRTPLYIMMVIALLPWVPFLIPMNSNSLLLISLSEFLTYPETSIIIYAVWCWLTVVVVSISGLLFQIHSRFDLNPFKQ